jgi:hypothetical protein
VRSSATVTAARRAAVSLRCRTVSLLHAVIARLPAPPPPWSGGWCQRDPTLSGTAQSSATGVLLPAAVDSVDGNEIGVGGMPADVG